MAKNYQSNKYKKNANNQDDFKRGPKTSINEKIDEERRLMLKDWITFYRNNIHRFVEHYMGINLFPYQRVWIYLISKSMVFLGLASRASAKSWLIGVYAVARCILYPGTTVALNSSTKSQAGLIISEKIQEINDQFPNIHREISNITTNANKWRVDFHNGSKINVVISGEGGRGHRSNICVLEERRLIPSVVIDAIIRPFLVARQAPFMRNPEYSHIVEEPQEIVITSVHYKNGEWYPESMKRLKRIAEGTKIIKAIFLDYTICLKHNIKTRQQMLLEKEVMDDITFSMEYGNLAFGGSSKSFYKIEFFKRTLKRAWLPRRLHVTAGRKNPYDIPRKPGERRIVSMDVAARGGETNDLTIIACARLFPSKKGWQTEIVYLESYSGENTVAQTLRLKQIYDEFTNFFPDDKLVLDVANVGIGIYDMLTVITHDEERDVDYEAMTVVEFEDTISEKIYDDLSGRCLTPDANPCIYPISGSAPLNSNIATQFRTRLKSGLLKFLVEDTIQEEFFIKKKNKEIMNHNDPTIKAFLLNPNIQTTLLINECISLDMSLTSGEHIKLEEPAGGRKDRYSSVSYLNYYASLLDQELLREDDTTDAYDQWAKLLQVV